MSRKRRKSDEIETDIEDNDSNIFTIITKENEGKYNFYYRNNSQIDEIDNKIHVLKGKINRPSFDELTDKFVKDLVEIHSDDTTKRSRKEIYTNDIVNAQKRIIDIQEKHIEDLFNEIDELKKDIESNRIKISEQENDIELKIIQIDDFKKHIGLKNIEIDRLKKDIELKDNQINKLKISENILINQPMKITIDNAILGPIIRLRLDKDCELTFVLKNIYNNNIEFRKSKIVNIKQFNYISKFDIIYIFQCEKDIVSGLFKLYQANRKKDNSLGSFNEFLKINNGFTILYENISK